MKPRARRSGLLLRELPDELLVYDLERHHAHCLNRTAALVFRHADGSRAPAELVRLLGPNASGEIVTLALGQLAAAGLLEPPQGEGEHVGAERISRREGARRIGLAAALLLPAVATIVAPTPVEAAATCVKDCQGQTIGTPCSTLGNTPCTNSCSNPGFCSGTTCSTGACSDGLGG
jgi:hypothetical protein